MGTVNHVRFMDFMGDFETTVYEGQTDTEVWASALVALGSEYVHIFHSLPETLDYLYSLNKNVRIFYHNLKFDGAFWLDYLMRETDMTQAYVKTGDMEYKWIEDKDMPNESFKYTISRMGLWYNITIRHNGFYIKIQDSQKILPFSVKQIGKNFDTKHKKLDMEYEGLRYAGCEITEEEEHYLSNDVLIVKEALEYMRKEGHRKSTIGSCCLQEFKRGYTKEEYRALFPDLTKIDCPIEGFDNADKYVRQSYRGGWCYLVKGKEDKIYENGCTYDVNSLYPSMMSSESGNHYPVGRPQWVKGKDIADIFRILENRKDIYYFVRIKTRFYLKEGKLPFIQIKNDLLYNPTEMLTTSDVYYRITKQHYKEYKTNDGQIHDTRVTLTLTKTDYILFREFYNVEDFEILDCCYFLTEEAGGYKGIFDEYINKYRDLKMNAPNSSQRQLAKLFLNNLYGKMASSDINSFKIARLVDGDMKFLEVESHEKEVGYIPIGSAITSYARNFTIRSAQNNYYGVDKPGFIYADTDSIHCDLPPDEMRGIKFDNTKFNCWKHEATWNKGIFHRQKTYIEHVTEQGNKKIKPYYSIKCAGMPQKCKDLLADSLKGYLRKDYEYVPEELEFLMNKNGKVKKRKLTCFKQGLCVYGKLLPKRIKGGLILEEGYFELRD